ncbi:MAG: translocation/assembly module TamB domain-containing protein [Bacteroidetes bacterium]|nr:translocation/assembly module TamB domain-containing protein [Bacteroidota bacterium]
MSFNLFGDKVIKKVLKIALGIVLGVLLLLSIVLLLFQYKPVQTWAAKKVAKSLSASLHTKVYIGALYLKPFSRVALDTFYVLDKSKDTLVNTPHLEVGINGFSLFSSTKKRVLDLSLVQLDNASVYLKDQKDGHSNLDFIIDYFKSPPDTTKNKKPGEPWKVIFEKVAINNMHFRYKNQKVDTLMKQVNFDDVDVHNFSTVVMNMDITHHLFKGDIDNLTLKEAKSGFSIDNLSGAATVDSNQIVVRHMHLKTGKTDLWDNLKMRFKSFDDFNHIETGVYMDGDFRQSRVSSSDIAYFTDGLNKTRFDLGLKGHITGYVGNLRSKNMLITGGQATYVKGDFNLKGLPDWKNTFLELNFEQVATNKRDIDYLYSNFAGDPTAKAPDIFSKFGDVNFTGRFAGLQNDFIAYGTFKTKLGRFDSDINLKIAKNGKPSYSGKISTYSFDLGKLIDVPGMGRTTLTADVNGSGDKLNTVDAKLNAAIKYITLNGYDYSNVGVNGTFARKVANGHVTVNDRNVKLDARGSVDLNPQLPVYNFSAKLDNAHLNALKLVSDTVTLSAQVNSDFSGNTLNNTQGTLAVSCIRVTDPRRDYGVDSLYLAANGIGNDRAIMLRSDLADGSLKGSYDLATLPAYFETIVKKYIPSLQINPAPFNPQNFAFNLHLKNLDPLLAFFRPDVKVPDQGTFVAKFNSQDKTATFNGYVKTITLGSTVFHDLIIDENTTDQYLGVNVSLSKINFSDSLFVKNIDITNFLKKDSLDFNIKLADKDATNQLDLYGLVQFARDTTARLKLLPSDVILEHQDWRIDNQVKIRLFNGKTQVSGFELANGSQKVKINGLISGNAADELKVDFEKFSMGTFDQLVKTADIKLKGTLNGNVVLSAITKAPTFDSHLAIDSFVMNRTYIGDVKVASSLDSNRKQANMKMNIVSRGLETMNIAGAYLLGRDSSQNSLDFGVKMNHSEAIIFAPFVKDLVSNLKGTISSDIKVTGSLSDPQFDGDISLENTGVTVNYLKTPYTINHTLAVKGSVINIQDLALTDYRGNTGIANGTVDMNDLSNPDIEVTLEAKNLLALNTTFKDNHLYFGTAFATGTFKFNGPTDNMNIDIKAKTEAGTVFNIPLNTSSTASTYEFIRYVDHRDTTMPTVQAKPFHGITLNFDLSADEKTTVKITTDYGKLEGNGTVNDLKLNISSLGDFNMYGNYLITSGKFEFVAKNVISKDFQVNQGGTIRWTGDPANAEINMTAVYELRTDISPLYAAAGQASTAKQANPFTLVQAELILTKSLLTPVIDFDFNFPTNPSIKDDLSTYLADDFNRNQQAVSVIVTRSFWSGTNTLTSAGTEAVSELAFSKLNAVISQSNAIKNFDLNIRSFNDASASLRLLNERIILQGSLFTNTGSNLLFANQPTIFNSNFNQLSKDFSAQYQILKNGDLSARYSYRQLSTTELNVIDAITAQYVNGLGLVYQRDFDTFGEFFRNIFRSHPKSAPVIPPPPKTPTQPPPATPIGDTKGFQADQDQ